jgi:hypothetical protein
MDIHRCRPEEFDALQNFWSTHWAASREGGSCSRDIQELRRKTFENPLADGQATAWLAWEQGRPVAHLGEILCPAYFEARKFESGWWSDFYALPGSDGLRPGNAAALLLLRVAEMQHGHALLGTPGLESRAAELYRALHFDYWGTVPFLYLVVDGAKLLRNLSMFRRNRFMANAAWAASYLYVPGKLLSLRHWRGRPSRSHLRVEIWQNFPSEADCLWNNVHSRFPLIFERSTPYLNWRYFGSRYERFGIFFGDRMIGWAVCKTTQMKDNKYFGDLRVGTMVDLLVNPNNRKDVQATLRAVLDRLLAQGAELVLTNLSDRRLVREARKVGFAAAPSNFHFFTRNLPKLAIGECHLTRGDSDGDGRL